MNADPSGEVAKPSGKKKGKTLPLTDFLKPASVGRWADEDVENDTRESPSRHRYRPLCEASLHADMKIAEGVLSKFVPFFIFQLRVFPLCRLPREKALLTNQQQRSLVPRVGLLGLCQITHHSRSSSATSPTMPLRARWQTYSLLSKCDRVSQYSLLNLAAAFATLSHIVHARNLLAHVSVENRWWMCTSSSTGTQTNLVVALWNLAHELTWRRVS